MNTVQRLELNWIGKHDPKNKINPEPRILIEKPDYSYSKSQTKTNEQLSFEEVQNKTYFDNMLIHGDNLLALKSLELEYAGKIKCIYIDPPYNTGSAFEHYDDNLEHSTWLGLMKPRLELLKTLLSNDGVIFVQIDNKELHYLKLLMDEVFGRNNYRNSIIVKKGVKNVSVQFETVEKLNAGYDTILVYSKHSTMRVPNLFAKVNKNEIKGSWNNHWRGTDRPTMRYELFNITPQRGQWRWSRERTYKAVENYNTLKAVNKNVSFLEQKEFDEFYKNYIDMHNLTENTFQLVRLSKNGKPEHYIPPSNKILLSENWLDLTVAGKITDFEHEKNECILKRILDWITSPGDLVLDSFLGSGTTAAVAHKMGRRWIGIELGDHAYTHCYKRLKAVVDGEQGGISKDVNWQGGGGFKFYELAPSLLERDKFGNPIISNKYDKKMLERAVAKHKGYYYQPDKNMFWKQSQNGDKNFLFVTKNHVTPEDLNYIHTLMKPDEHLLICSMSYEKECKNQFPNIIIQQMPKVLIGQCDFMKESYSLNLSQDNETEKEECSHEYSTKIRA